MLNWLASGDDEFTLHLTRLGGLWLGEARCPRSGIQGSSTSPDDQAALGQAMAECTLKVIEGTTETMRSQRLTIAERIPETDAQTTLEEVLDDLNIGLAAIDLVPLDAADWLPAAWPVMKVVAYYTSENLS